MSGRPTPNPCSGSTPKVVTRPRWSRSATPCSRSSGENAHEHRPRAAGHHRLPEVPRHARADRRGVGVHRLRAGLPGPRRHPGAAGRRGPQAGLTGPGETVMVTWFDESRLDDESVLTTYDAVLRPLAEAGARVRRESIDASAAAAEAVARSQDLARPRAVIAAGPAAWTWWWCWPRTAPTAARPRRWPRQCAEAARSWWPAPRARSSPSTRSAGGRRCFRR